MKEKHYKLKLQTADGMIHTVPFSVPCGEDGAPGKDYVLTTEDKHEIAKMAAEQVPSGGGSSLPLVSSTDNGKILKVVNGAWKAEALTKYLGEYEVV